MAHIKDISEKLLSFDKVEDVLVLDAGKEVCLVLTTSGQWSSYMPTQGFTALSLEDASVIADSYWHSGNFLTIKANYDDKKAGFVKQS